MATKYVGWWSLGYIEDDQKPVLDELDYDRVEGEREGLLLVFHDRAEVQPAVEAGMTFVAVDADEVTDDAGETLQALMDAAEDGGKLDPEA